MTARPEDVTAILVTRGDVDLTPIRESLIFGSLIVWDNSRRMDAGAYGRYIAAPWMLGWDGDAAGIVYVQDDDCVVPESAQLGLLDAYEDGILVSNMDENHNVGMPLLALPGWGAMFRYDLAPAAFARWKAAEPADMDSDSFRRVGCDIVFPVLTPSKMVNLGHENLPHAWAENRTHLQDGYNGRKRWYYNRAAEIRG